MEKVTVDLDLWSAPDFPFDLIQSFMRLFITPSYENAQLASDSNIA